MIIWYLPPIKGTRKLHWLDQQATLDPQKKHLHQGDLEGNFNLTRLAISEHSPFLLQLRLNVFTWDAPSFFRWQWSVNYTYIYHVTGLVKWDLIDLCNCWVFSREPNTYPTQTGKGNHRLKSVLGRDMLVSSQEDSWNRDLSGEGGFEGAFQKTTRLLKTISIPIGSMYGIFTYIHLP